MAISLYGNTTINKTFINNQPLADGVLSATFFMGPLAKLALLENEINQLEKELRNTPRSSMSYEDVEDVSDVYQARLEYNWWVQEQRDSIRDLHEQISKAYNELSDNEKAQWHMMNEQ